MSAKVCTKCGSTRFNNHDRCMDCRNARAKVRNARMEANGGRHTTREWRELLTLTTYCPDCLRLWSEVPPRSDPRYRTVWTKDHIVPVLHGGSDAISNIRPLCYQCNQRRLTKPLNTYIESRRVVGKMAKKLSAPVSRGPHKGQRLTPHIHEDGQFVVSKTRFEADYVRVRHESELPDWVEKGYSLRMSFPGGAPSLIRPASIVVDD